jgi:hypothetical protein
MPSKQSNFKPAVEGWCNLFVPSGIYRFQPMVQSLFHGELKLPHDETTKSASQLKVKHSSSSRRIFIKLCCL